MSKSSEIEEFTRELISRVHMSMTDSRVVKFNFIREGELVDVKIVFENVHKKH